jgi:uncharacterized damage-inducible protein DinB
MTISTKTLDIDPIGSNYAFLKEYFIELTAYINWADDFAMDWLIQITDEQWNQDAISSFGSIRDTAIHLVGAKKIWIDFWRGSSEKVYLSKVFNGSRTDLLAIWKNCSVDLNSFIRDFPAEEYTTEITIIKPNGEPNTMEFRKTFPHMVNHSTYHRGQLVTLLRQAGFSNFSNTDLFSFYNVSK